MTARTHDAIAFASLISFSVIVPPDNLNLYTLFAAVIGNVVGALVPDMDQAGNRLWDLLPAGDSLGKIFRRIFYKHRTITHSLLGFVAIFKLLGWLLPKFLNPSFIDPNIVFTSIMVGYISHLVADSLTEEGLPLFFPFKLKVGFPPISSWRIKTGGWFENLVVLPATGVYLVWFISTFKEELVSLLRSVSL